MRNKTLICFLAVSAVALWSGLIGFMNYKAPDSANQTIFLVIWWAAVTASAVPLAYILNARLAIPLGEKKDFTRALWQGLLLGALAVLLMALQFLHVLTLITGLILITMVVLTEILISLRMR
jgi:hypothetical protein